MPDVYKAALGAAAPQAAAPPNAFPTPSQGYDQPRDQRDYRDQRDQRDYNDRRDYRDRRDRDDDRGYRDSYPESRQITYPSDPRAQTFVPASNDPEYASPEEAEAAFIKLLKRSNVQPDWT